MENSGVVFTMSPGYLQKSSYGVGCRRPQRSKVMPLDARRAGQLALPVQEPAAEYYRGFLEHRALYELVPGKVRRILTPRCTIPALEGSPVYARVGDLMTWIGAPYNSNWRQHFKTWPAPAFIFYSVPAWIIADRVFGQVDPTDPRAIPSPLRERLAEVFEWRQARDQYEQLVFVAADYGMKLEKRPRPPAHPRARRPELDRLID